jgi:uncharacterized membrane protein SirB2
MNVDYLLLRDIHISCVVLSGTGFFARGVLMLCASPVLAQRWLRVVPHVVDSVLLGSAVLLALQSGQYPVAQGWLSAKLVALLAYIGCGTMALKRARTRGARLAYFVAALLIFAYIVSVAMTRSALGWLAYLA